MTNLGCFYVFQYSWRINGNLVGRVEDLDVVVSHDKLRGFGLFVEHRAVVPVAFGQLLFLHLFRVDDLGRYFPVFRLNVGKHVFRIQKFGINFVGRQVALANDENFGRLISGGGRLGGVHLFEKLAQHPDQTLIVFRAEHLSDKPAALTQEGGGQLEGMKRKKGLLVGVVDPILANVGRTVVEDQIGLGSLQFFSKRLLVPINYLKTVYP